MKRVLLFGATGFLGGHVASALADDPRDVTLIRAGRRSTPRHDLIADGVDRLAALLRDTRPDVVVNCTGLLSGGAAELVSANVLTTARLIDAVAAEVPDARLVVMGSAGEYGAVPVGRPVTEDSPTEPVATYGITKLASTFLIRSARLEHRLDAVSLRVFNPIGPGVGADTVLGRAAGSIRAAMEHGERSILLGPLSSYRDFVDVRDVGLAVSLAALADQVTEPVLNVGSGNAILIRDAVKLLAETAGFDGEIKESDPPQQRSGAVHWIAADISRIGKTLGWRPHHDLASSIQAIW